MALPAHATEQSPVSKPLLDVMRVSAEGEASAALVASKPGEVEEVNCQVVIIGAGLGGVSAALAATGRDRHTVCMTEPTLWVGGQATAQGVSAFDDNKYIDTTGGTWSYLTLSREIRLRYYEYLRDKPWTTSNQSENQALAGPLANPGGCWVGRLCFEPMVAEQVLMMLLKWSLDNGKLHLWTHTTPVSVQRNGRRIESVLVYDFAHEKWVRLHGEFFVEASELGDLLELSGLPYRIGAEAQAETHERNAPLVAQPHASQSFTYPFVLTKSIKGETTAPAKPKEYERFLPDYTLVVDYGHGYKPEYGFYEARKGLPGSFWVYRRSVDAAKFDPKYFPADRAMINWSSNDHCDANMLSNDPWLEAKAMQDAKRRSLGFAWWIENSVSRDDHSGTGYADLQILPAEMGTTDGLSQFPYIRESRRIVPVRTIVEEDLAVDFQHGVRAVHYPDTIGIGWYAIDIHSCERKDFVSTTKPYEIPLGALIDRDADNLLAVGKTIGTTHITNGAYRLHPTEWADGEAAGTAIEFALENHTTPLAMDSNPQAIQKLQSVLAFIGHPIYWYDDVPVRPLDTDFIGMQMAGARGWWQEDTTTLHAHKQMAVTGDEAANLLAQVNINATALRGKNEITWADLQAAGVKPGRYTGTVRRAEFAASLSLMLSEQLLSNNSLY